MPDMPSFEREELDQTARNLLRTRRRSVDLGYGSDWDITARTLGALSWIMFKQAKLAYRMLGKASAFGEYLRQYAYEHGVGRDVSGVTTAPVRATGKVIIRSTTGSQTQLTGSVLRHADGSEYTLDADVTTPATATKTLRAGHRSGRQRLYQGHAGAGFVTAVAGEVYQFAGTGEYCALRDVENSATLQRHLFDLYNELDADPEIHDQFVQTLGAVGNITASVAGIRGNKDAKDVLSVVSPAGTVVAEAVILYLTGGADEMSPSGRQQALRELLSVRGELLAISDLRDVVRSYPRADVRECYVIPATSGISTYTILPVLAEGQYVGATMLSEILSYVQARTVDNPDKFSGAAVYESVDTEIATLNIHVSSQYQPDWTLPDPASQGIDVTACTASTITLSTADDVPVGGRIIVANFGTSGPYVVQRRATAVDTGTEVVTLDEPLPFPADVGDSWVTPGGPLGEAVIEAIYAAYESRGPRIGATGSVIRYPTPIVVDSAQGILAAVSDVPGVTDVNYIATGVDPAISAPGCILVPRMSIIMSIEDGT